jgi:hypothetical protein
VGQVVPPCVNNGSKMFYSERYQLHGDWIKRI